MTSIVRRFKKINRSRVAGSLNSGEVEANTLRREIEDMQRDTERYVGQARQLIERERVREGER